eukprot:4594018-Prorocentrum_lima.AAC.1
MDILASQAGYAMYGDGCAEAGDLGSTEGYDGWDLALPQLYFFPTAKHSALRCVLDKFDATQGGSASPLSALDDFCLRPQERWARFEFYGLDEK